MLVPSAASFYVPNLPDLHQDSEHPLHIYSGHISSDPEAANLPANTVTAHIFFVLVKARRTADKERVLFWFNVCLLLFRMFFLLLKLSLGRARLLVIWWFNDGNRSLQARWKGWSRNYRRRLGRVHQYGFQYVVQRVARLWSTHNLSVDQPAGTGYSYTSTDRYVHELTEVSNTLTTD